jgi:hypothetical protein
MTSSACRKRGTVCYAERPRSGKSWRLPSASDYAVSRAHTPPGRRRADLQPTAPSTLTATVVSSTSTAFPAHARLPARRTMSATSAASRAVRGRTTSSTLSTSARPSPISRSPRARIRARASRPSLRVRRRPKAARPPARRAWAWVLPACRVEAEPLGGRLGAWTSA